MSLPKLDRTIYNIEQPSTGKQIKVMPFTLKEEKLLLTAQESRDKDQIITTIKQVVNNCLLDVTLDDLTIFDFEYLFIFLRSKSVNNIVEFEIEDPETNEPVKLELNINDIKVHKTDTHTNKIQLDSTYTLFMKYPAIDDFVAFMDKEEITAQDSFDLLISCMDKLVSDDEVFKFADFSKQEIDDFVESMSSEATSKMKEFFDTMPKTRHELNYVNSKGTKQTFVLEGTQSFFI